MRLAQPLTDRVIGLAIEVHRHTGPFLPEPCTSNAVAAIVPIHAMRRRTCLRGSGIRVDLLLNFDVPRLVVCPGEGRQRPASPRGVASPARTALAFSVLKHRRRGPRQAMPRRRQAGGILTP